MLAVILPTAEQTAMLRACLFDGETGRQAWANWQEKYASPRTLNQAEGPAEESFGGPKRLLPMLAEASRRNRIELEPGLQRVLLAARMWEQLRAERFRSICHDVLEELNKRNIDFVVLKGVALANTDYPDAALRHCHDCDLLINDETRDEAIQTLVASGFKLLKNKRGSDGATVIVHESGLPIRLHVTLFPIPHYAAPLYEICSRAQTQEVCGVPARILSRVDRLLHVCGHASCSASREHLCWVCDSWMIMSQDTKLDWTLFYEMADRCKLVLPLSVMLRYLAKELDAPVPADLLSRLEDASATVDRLDQEASLFGAAASSRGNRRNLWKRATGWSCRVVLARWMFFPAPRFIRWKYGLQRSWPIPIYYLYRPIRAIIRLLWRQAA